MTKDVEITVTGPKLKKDMLGAVPLVDHLLDEIFVLVQPKANRPFVSFSSGVAMDL